MLRRRQWSNLRNGTETKTYKDEKDENKNSVGERIITTINNNAEERTQEHYKEQEKREDKG
eukprot:118549-Heterocapsa_arctica.AAC.1